MKDYKTLYGSLVTGNWPATVAKNASGPSASDGTPFTADLINDIWGSRVDLMVRAGLTPDGVTEANGTSQFVKALHRVVQGPGIIVFSALNATELALRRLIALAGQVLTIASYPELCAAVYCGDANNATAEAFYKTSDSGGTTRSTSGTYMVMPDARGLVVRGIGSNAKIFAANGASYTGGALVGALLTDMMQSHLHIVSSRADIAGGSANTVLIPGSGGAVGTPVTDGTYGTPRAGEETRGASLGAQICISY